MECEEEEAIKEDFFVSDVGNWISSLRNRTLIEEQEGGTRVGMGSLWGRF